MTNVADSEDRVSGILKNDGERMIPEFHQSTLIYAEHIQRYLALEGVCAGKKVLDIASGSGYGTQILGGFASEVIGVDISGEAIQYARIHYNSETVEFRQGSCSYIPIEDNSVDVVVSFETIEHLDDYVTFLDEIQRVLSPDGICIISTPNDIESPPENHFHIHEFKYEELDSLLKERFAFVESYFQTSFKGIYLSKLSEAVETGSQKVEVQNFAPIEPDRVLYFFFICSNEKPVTEILSTFAIGEHLSGRDDNAFMAAKNAEILRAGDRLWEQEKSLDSLTVKNIELDSTNIELDSANRKLTSDLEAILTSPSYRLVLRIRKLLKR